MNAAILSIGNELVTGQCVDTNAAWLAESLTGMGLRVAKHVTVDDEISELSAAFREATRDYRVVIATGGLGPTDDDLTRQALAAAIGKPLMERPEALRQIEAFFARLQRPFGDSNKVQALIPETCRVLQNQHGTAPGIWHHSDTCDCFALPGVPFEMKEMFRGSVVPVISTITAKRRTVTARVLTFGWPEAKVGDAVADLMVRGRNPTVGTTASGAVISLRVVSCGESKEEALGLSRADVAEIERRLGSIVFGQDDDTLGSAVGRLLVDRRKTVTTAESCTGGLLAKMLTDVPGSSAYFLSGLVTYANEAKTKCLGVPAELIAEEGTVSENVAKTMAEKCREQSGSDYALATTGIAGPDGGDPPRKPVGLVYVALADRDGVEVKRLLLGEHLSRTDIRDRACKAVLNMLRLRFMEG